MYRCASCGLAVILTNDGPIRACKCEATIIVELSATVNGQGGVSG